MSCTCHSSNDVPLVILVRQPHRSWRVGSPVASRDPLYPGIRSVRQPFCFGSLSLLFVFRCVLAASGIPVRRPPPLPLPPHPVPHLPPFFYSLMIRIRCLARSRGRPGDCHWASAGTAENARVVGPPFCSLSTVTLISLCECVCSAWLVLLECRSARRCREAWSAARVPDRDLLGHGV